MCKQLLAIVTFALLGASAAQANELRDPTRPLDYRASDAGGGQAEALQLQSILIGGGRKLAVINGRAHREGEAIAGAEGARVQNIEPGSVTIAHDGDTRRLQLNRESVRQ